VHDDSRGVHCLAQGWRELGLEESAHLSRDRLNFQPFRWEASPFRLKPRFREGGSLRLTDLGPEGLQDSTHRLGDLVLAVSFHQGTYGLAVLDPVDRRDFP